ncbi:hypothetical protein RSOLAG22IIIB_11388 [Rhizoctonia solani]|uniref:Uncharacterized protein n=1 Tax=Rhizoctonia solani TaxID=456999 RepID=A0A0K6G866_9AGAM|nr:hypothetical protein RSOLAG22IIIB_11388 [Rhizoctonia solani]
MAETASTTFDAHHAYHQAHSDGDAQEVSGLPPSSSNPSSVNRPIVPCRSHSLHHGLADAPQATTVNGTSLVEQRASKHSNISDSTESRYQSTEHLGPQKPRAQEETPCTCEYACDANSQDSRVAPPTGVGCQNPVIVAVEPFGKPVPKSSPKKSQSGDLPLVKMLLYGDPKEPFSAADIEGLKAVGLKCCADNVVRLTAGFDDALLDLINARFDTYFYFSIGVNGLHRENIRICSGCEPIGKEFEWFLDPDDIALGGLLILCITGHGTRTTDGVDIKTNPSGPKLVDTFDLHVAINKLQVPCTLEIIFGTCNSEAVISGLDRLLVMQSSEDPHEDPNALLPLNALFKSLLPVSLVPRLDTEALIIVWAAAVDGGAAYPEADLPGRKGKNDIVIGAICRAFESATEGISRRALFGKIQQVSFSVARVIKPIVRP